MIPTSTIELTSSSVQLAKAKSADYLVKKLPLDELKVIPLQVINGTFLVDSFARSARVNYIVMLILSYTGPSHLLV